MTLDRTIEEEGQRGNNDRTSLPTMPSPFCCSLTGHFGVRPPVAVCCLLKHVCLGSAPLQVWQRRC